MATAALLLHGLNYWDGRRPKPLLPEARLVDDYATSPGGSTVRFELLKARVVNVGKVTFTVDSVMVERPMAHRARFVDMHLGRDSATLPPGEQATYYVESRSRTETRAARTPSRSTSDSRRVSNTRPGRCRWSGRWRRGRRSYGCIAVSDLRRGIVMGPTEWLTLALVLITMAYAWLTHRTVQESRRAREQQLRPHLKLHFVPMGGGVIFPAVVSTGPGPVLDAEITVTAGQRDGSEPLVLTLRRQYIAAGEPIELMVPHDQAPQKTVARFQEYGDLFTYLTLDATCRDVLGNEHTIRDGIEDLAQWFDAWGGVYTRATPDEAKRSADALRAIKDSVKRLADDQRRLVRLLEDADLGSSRPPVVVVRPRRRPY